jgi:glycosyltransferase involved in cell wall biosynthesis
VSIPAAAPQGERETVVTVLVISDLEFGGAQRQVVELANHLHDQHVTAYVCSLSPYAPLAKHLHRKELFRVIPRRSRYDVTVVPRLGAFLRQVRADVVHAFLFDAEIASRLAGRLVRRPVTIGSERNTHYSSKTKDLWALRLTRSLQDLVVANSNAGADFNSSLIGFPRHLYRVIRNGVDVQRFRPRGARDERARLGVPSDAVVVGMFASLKPQKNHGLLLDEIPHIVKCRSDVRFLFVGDSLHKGMSDSDTYKNWFASRLDALGIAERCICVGNREDVERLYPACDVTVLPSLFEGTPNAALESLACGVPVVVRDVSDNRQIVPNGDVGFVVPNGDGVQLRRRVIELLTDESLRGRMSRRARDWAVEQFSTRRLAEQTATVYREAIRSKRGNPNLL